MSRIRAWEETENSRTSVTDRKLERLFCDISYCIRILSKTRLKTHTFYQLQKLMEIIPYTSMRIYIEHAYEMNQTIAFIRTIHASSTICSLCDNLAVAGCFSRQSPCSTCFTYSSRLGYSDLTSTNMPNTIIMGMHPTFSIRRYCCCCFFSTKFLVQFRFRFDFILLPSFVIVFCCWCMNAKTLQCETIHHIQHIQPIYAMAKYRCCHCNEVIIYARSFQKHFTLANSLQGIDICIFFRIPFIAVLAFCLSLSLSLFSFHARSLHCPSISHVRLVFFPPYILSCMDSFIDSMPSFLPISKKHAHNKAKQKKKELKHIRTLYPF